MTFRELLQIELWSKRTTRKILIMTGIATALLVMLFAVWFEVEWHWLTPGERNGARAALVEIDLLQSASSMNGKEFDLQEEKAQLKFETARDLMRTHRDRDVVAVLSAYLILTTSPWDEAQLDIEYPVSSSKVDADRKSELKSWASDTELRKQLRTLLHKELD